jgi:predicted O-methyltransferase YrrM
MEASRIHGVIQELLTRGSVVDGSGVERSIFPVALDPHMAVVLRDWVQREKAVQTIEVGLAYGFSTLHICEGLVRNGNPNAKIVAIDPNQLTGYSSAGLRSLEYAGVSEMVEFHSEESQLLLPAFVKEGRSFDLAFVDGNHRFDYVFVDLFFLGRLIRKGGVIILDDCDLPGIRRVVSFFVTNAGWTIADTVGRIVILRTATTPDTRDFRFFAAF